MSAPASSVPLRALFVEHSPEDVELCLYELRAAGLMVSSGVATTPQELQKLLATQAWDVVLADYQLLGWTGMDAWRLVRESGQDAPFILVTGTLGEESVVECLKQGVADCVLKSRLKRLPLAVRRAMEERILRADRQRAVEALRQAEEKYRGIFENAVEGIYQTTLSGRILTANPMLARILAYPSPQQLVEEGIEIARVHADAARWEEFSRLVSERGLVAGFEAQIRRRNGDLIWVSESARAVRDGPDVLIGFEGAMIDITERKQLETQLQQAQKMEAVGQLAGGIAHDFNNLLGVVAGYADLMLKELAPDAAPAKRLEAIRRAVDRATALVRQLLAFSRKQVLQPRVLNLNVVVAEAEDMLRRLIGEDVQLRTNCAADLGRVKVDPGQLQQVMLNLALNARDAMPQGGTLILETSNLQLDESCAWSRPGVEPGPYAVLAVSDTGHGMDAETQGRIFEPFFTTKAQGKGTGLGLATVYGIVKQSGGHITLHSEVGSGSTFRVHLPRTEEPEPELVPQPAREPGGGSETVLLVEDLEELRAIIREILEGAGYRVLESLTAEGALSLAESHDGPLHLLVTDVVMPGKSGREVASNLAAARPEMRTLFISGYTSESLDQHGVLAGIPHFLGKPFTADALLRKVREILDS